MKPNHPSTVVFTRLLYLLLSSGLVSCMTGCVVPMPCKDSGFTRTNVNEQVVRQFVPDQTTEEDVIMILGEPDAVSAGDRDLAYRSEKLSAFWFVPSDPVILGGPIYNHRYYIFAFDPSGRFQGLTQTNEQPPLASGWQRAAVEGPAIFGGSNGVTVVVSGYAYWLPHVDGFRGGVTQAVGGTLGYFLLTQSHLIFVSESNFADARPVLDLPLSSISEVALDRYLLSRLLVIHTDTGSVHSFRIWGTSAGEDGPAMKTARAFIQSQINSTQPEK